MKVSGSGQPVNAGVAYDIPSNVDQKGQVVQISKPWLCRVLAVKHGTAHFHDTKFYAGANRGKPLRETSTAADYVEERQLSGEAELEQDILSSPCSDKGEDIPIAKN